MMTKPNIPIEMIEPERQARACCNHDCDQGDTCPERLQSTNDVDHRELMRLVAVLLFCWMIFSTVLVFKALT